MEGTRSSKKRVFLIVMLLIVIGGLITALVILNSPKNVAIRSVKNFFGDVVKRDEVKPLYKTLKRGSIEFSLEDITKIDTDGETYDVLGGDYYSGKLYFKKNKIMLDNFDASIDDVELQGSLFLSDKEMYVSEDNILEGTYGFKFSDLLAELEDSIFAADSDSEYAIDDDIYDFIVTFLENIEDLEKLGKDVKKTSKKVVKNIVDIVFDNAEVSSDKNSVRIGGQRTKVRQITISIDGDAMANIVMEIYNYLRDSKDVSKLINEYDDALYAFIIASGMDDEYDSFSEAYEEFFEESEDSIDDYCEEVEDYFEDLDIIISTPKRQAKLLMLEIEYDGEEVFSIDCGKKGVKKTDTITIEFDGVTMSYEVSVNNRKAYESELEVDCGKQKYIISIAVDKKADSYEVVYEDRYGDFKDKHIAEGSISKKFGKTTLTLDKVTNKWSDLYYGYDAKTTYKIDCNVVIDTWDRMPKREKNYNTIADISEKDIEEWLENVEDIYK